MARGPNGAVIVKNGGREIAVSAIMPVKRSSVPVCGLNSFVSVLRERLVARGLDTIVAAFFIKSILPTIPR